MGTWLKGAAPAIGRIDMENHLYWKKYAGTGWFITNSIVVTNRHVALEFAEKIKASYKMKKGTNNKEIKVSIGLLHEDGITDSVDVPVQEVLYIAPEQDEDIAFLQTSSIEDTGFRSLDYSTNPPETDAEVMVIGFPYWDGDRNDVEVMQKVFRYLYGTKRVAPGTITGVTEKTITHNCSTLSGNSGSPVIEITTGKVVAVHYYGLYEKTNFAVPMKRVAEMLQPFTEDSIFS
jgi:S1-C subfamily serine protease